MPPRKIAYASRKSKAAPEVNDEEGAGENEEENEVTMSSQSQPSDDFRGQRILSHTNNGVYHRFFITYIQYWFNTSPSAMVISTLLILFPFYF